MKGSFAALACAAVLIAAVISSPIDKPKKNIKKYLYKKQGPAASSGGELYLPSPHKTKSNSYKSARSFPSVVYISDSPDDESSPLSPSPSDNGPSGSATSGITDFFDRISRTFSRSGVKGSSSNGKKERYSPDPEQISGYHDHSQDDEGPVPGGPPQQYQHQPGGPTAFPSSPVGDHLQDDEPSSEREDDEESGEDSDEEEEEDEEEDDAQDDLQEGGQGQGQGQNEQRQKLKNESKNKPELDSSSSQFLGEPQIGLIGESAEENPIHVQSSSSGSSSSDKKSSKDKNKKNKNKDKEETPEENEENAEESEEEEEENDDIPEDVPPFIRQQMIEEKRKKQQEEAQGGHQGGHGGHQGQGGHHGRPGPGQGQGQYGGPGGPGGQQGQGPPQGGGFGSGAGGFLSSLLG